MNKSIGENKSFGDKISNVVKYIGNDFWKLLPVGSLINCRQKRQKEDEKNRGNSDYNPLSLKSMATDAFHVFYAIAGGLAITAYISNGIEEGKWNPNYLKDYLNKPKTEQVNKVVKQNELERSMK